MALVYDTPRWKYVLTAMDGSIPAGAGEIYWPNQRAYADQLNGVRTAACSVAIDHPRLAWLLNNDALLKVYRRDRTGTWKLMLTGDAIQYEEQGTGGIGNVIITASDGFWRITKRLIAMAVDSGTNQATGLTIGSPTAQVDYSNIVAQILDNVNNTSKGGFPTGVSLGTVTLCNATDSLGPIYAVFGGPTIQQLCSMLGGPDIWIVPQEPSGSMPNTVIGQMNIAPYRGSFKQNAIFEYGCGKHNVQSYTRMLTKQGAMNHGVALPQGWPNSIGHGDSVAVNDDTTSQNSIGRFDDIVSTDVVNLNLRNLLVQEAVSVRKTKQQQITFQPVVDSGVEFPLDYDVGDVVIARAYEANSQSFRYNGSVRVYGVSVAIDDQDAETVTLTLIPDQFSAQNAGGGGF